MSTDPDWLDALSHLFLWDFWLLFTLLVNNVAFKIYFYCANSGTHSWGVRDFFTPFSNFFYLFPSLPDSWRQSERIYHLHFCTEAMFSPALRNHQRNISNKASLVWGLHLLHLLYVFFLLALSAVAEEWPVFYPKQDIDAFLMDYTARPNKLCAADLFPVWIRDKEQGSEGGFWWRHFCKPGERLFWE